MTSRLCQACARCPACARLRGRSVTTAAVALPYGYASAPARQTAPKQTTPWRPIMVRQTPNTWDKFIRWSLITKIATVCVCVFCLCAVGFYMVANTGADVLPQGSVSTLTSSVRPATSHTECVHFWYHTGGENSGKQDKEWYLCVFIGLHACDVCVRYGMYDCRPCYLLVSLGALYVSII